MLEFNHMVNTIESETVIMKRKQFRKLKVKLKRAMHFFTVPFQSKLVINHILLIILPVLTVFYFIFSTYASDKRQEAINLTHIANQQAMETIDSLFVVMEELTKQPIYDSLAISRSPVNQQTNIMEILKQSNRENKDNQNMDGIVIEKNNSDPNITYARTTEENMAIDKLLKRILLFNENIHSVFLFNLHGKYEYRMQQYSLASKLNSQGEAWFQKCRDMNGNVNFFIGEDFRKSFRSINEKEYHFSIARAVIDTQSVNPAGIICININKSFLRETCGNIMTVPGERILIIDENSRIIYDTVEENISKDVSQIGFPLPDLSRIQTGKSFMIHGEKYLMDAVDSGNEYLKLVRIMPENMLFMNLRTMTKQFMFLILLFVLLSLLLSVSLTYGITKPMKKLIMTMRVVERGDLSIRFPVKQKDEIGLLGHSFNKMIRKVETLIDAVYISQIREKEAELDALQSQINPHFIYNTLESIRMMAELNDDASTSRMTFMLARLLRYSISTKKQKVTVRQEVEHLKNYLELQNMRYGDKFELIVDLSEYIYESCIIKLVFQPVVENAIVHGLEGISDKGIIKITGYHENDRIILKIEDNGVGMSAEQVEELNRKINDFSQPDSDKGGIGLKNVNERIQLHYGEGYGLKLSSEPGKGTVVLLEFHDGSTTNPAKAI